VGASKGTIGGERKKNFASPEGDRGGVPKNSFSIDASRGNMKGENWGG